MYIFEYTYIYIRELLKYIDIYTHVNRNSSMYGNFIKSWIMDHGSIVHATRGDKSRSFSTR